MKEYKLKVDKKTGIYDNGEPSKRVGIVIDHLGESQKAFEIINGINSFMETRSDISVNIFVLQHTNPIIAPRCGVFHASETRLQYGTLIATCEKTWETIRSISNSKRVMLIYDKIGCDTINDADLILSRGEYIDFEPYKLIDPGDFCQIVNLCQRLLYTRK